MVSLGTQLEFVVGKHAHVIWTDPSDFPGHVARDQPRDPGPAARAQRYQNCVTLKRRPLWSLPPHRDVRGPHGDASYRSSPAGTAILPSFPGFSGQRIKSRDGQGGRLADPPRNYVFEYILGSMDAREVVGEDEGE